MADEPDEAQTFGGLLHALRIAAGFTQEQLAESSGLGIRTIRDLERGRVRRPHRESVGPPATALGPGLGASCLFDQNPSLQAPPALVSPCRGSFRPPSGISPGVATS